MAESPIDESLRRTREKMEQFNRLNETGKYRLGQIGIDKETNHIIFYADNQATQEIYYISLSDLQTHDKQIFWIYRLLEKKWFRKQTLRELFTALVVLGLMPEQDV